MVLQVSFYLTGLICWNYFASCLTLTSENIHRKRFYFWEKFHFPRLIISNLHLFENLLKVVVQDASFGCICLFLTEGGRDIAFVLDRVISTCITPNWFAGLGFWNFDISFTTKYRDLQMLLGFGVQLWMYASPVAYSVKPSRHTVEYRQ